MGLSFYSELLIKKGLLVFICITNKGIFFFWFNYTVGPQTVTLVS